MGKTKDLTPKKLSAIKALIETNEFSNRQIASQLMISEASVRRTRKKIDYGDDLLVTGRKNCGRKKIFTPRCKRLLTKICLKNRFSVVKDLQSDLSESDVTASTKTIRRTLNELGLKARRPAKKPKLTEAMRAKRLKWAKSLKHKDLDYWNSVSLM